MTSDAKIGLLLGLVFIFVIAFIINGLPNLRPQQATRADVPVVVGFQDDDVGVTGKTQARVGGDWSTLVDEQEPAEPTPAAQPATAGPSAPQAQSSTHSEVRFEGPLPAAGSPFPKIENPLARIENLLDRLTQQSQAQEAVSTINLNVPEPAAAERQLPIQTVVPRAEVPATQTAVQTPEQPKPGAASAVKPVTATTPKPVGQVYVVGEGESLSTVAKNVYGPEEGNRYVNINRIYEVNKDVLKSVDEVVAGQKLVIPPLPKATPNPNKPSDVLSKELFEKVDSIGKRPASQTTGQTVAPAQTQTQKQTPVPAATSEGRWYTVQEGDNLWKIASAQLGAGARYEEIAKLNVGLLKDGVKLSVGMKIQLPEK
jgi:nucleoid-associated protein YgaU